MLLPLPGFEVIVPEEVIAVGVIFPSDNAMLPLVVTGLPDTPMPLEVVMPIDVTDPPEEDRMLSFHADPS